MKSKNFIINCGTYPFDVMISIGQTKEELRKSLLKYTIPLDEIDDGYTLELSGSGRYVQFSNWSSLIRLKYDLTDPFGKGILAHEINHCVFYMMKKMGMKHTSSSEEAYAYLTGYLTEKIYERISKDDSKSIHSTATLQSSVLDRNSS